MKTTLWNSPGGVVGSSIILAGILLGQLILYGPSLTGNRILLPLDILAQANVYIPRTPEVERIEPQDLTLADWDFVYEPNRRFAISELKLGRLPMWAPFEFAGVPFTWPKFSPFLLAECCAETPAVLAWGQVLVALLTGTGAYLFFRRALGLSFWPAAVGAWCYPLTGFFIFWQGCATGLPVVWLPWLLLAVARAVKFPGLLSILTLATTTCLVLISGFLDVAGQVLLGSGLFGLWLCFRASTDKLLGEGPAIETALGSKSSTSTEAHARDVAKEGSEVPRLAAVRKEMSPAQWRTGMRTLIVGWALGFCLAAPYLLPVLEYAHTGARMARRGGGQEERPPVGLAALPQIVLPDMYGSNHRESARFATEPQQESSAAAYAGILGTLLIAPLAFFSRRHRAASIFLLGLGLFGLSWCLDIPGVVSLLRLPGLNMMSHNRMVFLACFSIVALAVVGLEALLQELVCWRWWLWGPVAVLGCLCLWCVYRTTELPPAIRTDLVALVSHGKQVHGIHDEAGVQKVQGWFVQYYAASAVWCGAGLLGWLALKALNGRHARLVPIYGGLLVADLLWFGYGRNVQSDPSLYYPAIPALQSLAKAAQGERIIGFGCLPAPVSSMCGLWDVRGYDAVDPARIVEVVKTAADPGSKQPVFAATIQLAPKAFITPAGDIRLPGALDMLSVRYVIMRGSPPTNACPVFRGTDYWVLRNPAALPRAYVPKRVELITDKTLRLQRLSSPMFNPREVAYIETTADLPAACQGTAEIRGEIPTRVSIAAQMETAGLLVLADRWDVGWRAYVDGVPTTILRANHAIRGVILTPGAHDVEFRYEPASFAWGLRLAGIGGGIIVVCSSILLWRRLKGRLWTSAGP